MTFSWIAGRESVLPVYGPNGVDTIVEGFQQAYSLDEGYRTEHHKPFLNKKFHGIRSENVPYPETKDGNVVIYESKISGMKILAFEGEKLNTFLYLHFAFFVLYFSYK